MSERHDWLNLIEVSGPFLSIPVLDEAFPQGLEGRDKRDAARLRQAYDEWREAVDVDDSSLDELHRAWVDEVLATALQMGDRDLRRGDQIGDALHVSLPEHGVILTPDIVLVNVNDTDTPLLPMFVQSPNAPLDEVVHRDGWAVTPAERMVQYLRGVDCPIGLVTNGERWMLVHAPAGQVTSFVSWYARLWSQEPDTLRAFVSLLAVPRFYGPEEGQLPSLFAKSEKHQDEVTEALGDQVRTAIEVLVQAIDRANQDRNGKLLEGVTPQELYEGGLTVMMRLVFILSAEERGLLLLGNTTYDNHYALSTFRQRLRRVSSNAHELLERRHAGWSRLLALFRAIYGGIEHSDLRLPAMGGSLFDPDRYPFLEGRAKGSNWLTDAADPLPIDDRTVLLMLDAIQSFEGRTLSYRALDVEQIGHVYEGLLERTVRQIDEVTLELRGSAQAKSPKATLRELAEAGLDGQETLIELLKERTGRSVPALRRDLQRSRDDRLFAALLTACRGDPDLCERIERYVHLMALDPWDHPRLYHPGAYAVVMGHDRRETGTHYTPKSLTEKIVHETLTPVAYVGPAEGKPKEEWRLKSSAELLDLKVCDPAMGSGAFLVQACRWLGERLVEAWRQAENSGGVVSVDGEVLESADESELLPRDAEERTVIARRLVAESCLYGVDMNPLAVELAKLSIWLVTLSEGRPFGFLDHNLRCGNSLLGITRLDQLTELALKPSHMRQSRLFGQSIREVLDEALELRRQLRETPIRDIRDVEAMAALDSKVRKKLELPERLADAFIGSVLAVNNPRMLEGRINSLSIQADLAVQGDAESYGVLIHQADHDLEKDVADGYLRRPFHWPIEFPEIFCGDCGGFDSIVGNPPFLGGRKMRQALGERMLQLLLKIWPHSSLNADLCSFFYLRSEQLVRVGGGFGLLATKTIAQGDTARTGLSYLLKQKKVIISFAISSFDWPGTASVVSSLVVARKGAWLGSRVLNGADVDMISEVLDDQGGWGDAKRIPENINASFQGSVLVGKGFILSEDAAAYYMALRKENSEVLKPYLSGDDLNTHPRQKASRWVIDFRDFDLGYCQKRWPELISRIEETVKPEREKKRRLAHKRYWWQHGDKRPALYSRIRMHDYAFVVARVTKYVAVVRVSTDQVFHDKVYVFDLPGWTEFSILQSSFHDLWVRRGSSTVGATLNYTPSDYFDTYPLFGASSDALDEIGEKYHAHRDRVMFEQSIGLTEVYNKFHDPENTDALIGELRDLHANMDKEVASSFGWDDLELEHRFCDVKGEIRFSFDEDIRNEIVKRILILNQRICESGASNNLPDRAGGAVGKNRLDIGSDDSQCSLSFGYDSFCEAVYNYLEAQPGWHSKSIILEGAGVPKKKWTRVINLLIEKGAVERQGERRGARYRAVRNGP